MHSGLLWVNWSAPTCSLFTCVHLSRLLTVTLHLLLVTVRAQAPLSRDGFSTVNKKSTMAVLGQSRIHEEENEEIQQLKDLIWHVRAKK